jgi:hypothetical protein
VAREPGLLRAFRRLDRLPAGLAVALGIGAGVGLGVACLSGAGALRIAVYLALVAAAVPLAISARPVAVPATKRSEATSLARQREMILVFAGLAAVAIGAYVWWRWPSAATRAGQGMGAASALAAFSPMAPSPAVSSPAPLEPTVLPPSTGVEPGPEPLPGTIVRMMGAPLTAPPIATDRSKTPLPWLKRAASAPSTPKAAPQEPSTKAALQGPSKELPPWLKQRVPQTK